MFLDNIHLDKNGNPMKGAALTSHIIHTHFNGLDDFAKAVVKATLAMDKQQKQPKSRSDATLIRRAHFVKDTFGRLGRKKRG